MFKWFMAKTLITKIIIVTSSVVVIGGVGAGVIIVPKQIEKYKQEEQLRIENEEDLANMSIVIKDEFKTNGITLPLNLVTQGIETIRYTEIENALPTSKEDEKDKEKVKNALIEVLVDRYTGGELSVEENIDINKRGDYPVTFTVTSEKGNTKSEIVNVKVFNFYRVQIYLDNDNVNQTKTITKGTDIDIMEGVTFNSILPEEEQGHIETTGTVDVNTVGTYTVTYTYIPKDENEGVISEMTRTYNVVEPLQIKQNVRYVYENDILVNWFIFKGNSFKWCYGYRDSGSNYQRGTYTISNGIITFHSTHSCDEGYEEEKYNATFTGKLASNGKSITIEDTTYSLK